MSEQDTPKGEAETFSQDQVNEMIAAAVEKETGGLKSKVDELLGESKAAKAKAKEEAEARAKAADEAAKKSGDVEALEKSWQEKLAQAERERDAQLSGLQSTVEALTVGSAAKDIAAELAIQGSASVLERIARDRLSVEMTDEGPRVRVKDATGKPSAATLDDLKAELTNDSALKPLIIGGKASGGGAANANGGAGGGKKENRSTMNAESKAAYIREHGRDAYNSLPE